LDEATDEVIVSNILKAPKNKKDLGYLNWFDFEDENSYYLKTQTSKTRKTYLQTISKDTLDINSIELKNDYYSSYLYKGKLYAASSTFVNGNACILMDVYNSDLSLEYSKNFEYEIAAMVPGGLVVDDEKIYMVCGAVGEGASYGATKTYLFEFDLNFNFLSETDLQLNDAGYQSTVKIDNFLYLAKTSQGVDSQGEGIGSAYIDRYNLDKKEMEFNFIKLDKQYPYRIKHDAVNNNLIVLHERWSAGNNYYSIYNLEDNSLDTVLLDNALYGDKFVFQGQSDDKYYFQTPQRLGVYDVKSKTIKEYDLTSLNLDLSNGIFFTE
ncbi:MAG: hypothetical protein RR011_03010, partial [Oscillospiraceae bacterium]